MKKQKFEDRVYNIVTLGEGRVGKTSIISRFFHNSFQEQTQETTECYYKEKIIQTKKDLLIQNLDNVYIIYKQDTAGQEKYHCLASLYYRNSDIAIIVYDITVKATLNQSNWQILTISYQLQM